MIQYRVDLPVNCLAIALKSDMVYGDRCGLMVMSSTFKVDGGIDFGHAPNRLYIKHYA